VKIVRVGSCEQRRLANKNSPEFLLSRCASLIYLDKPWLHDFSAVRIFLASVRLRTPLPEWNQPEAFGTTLLRCRGAVADTPVADAPIRDPFGGYADRKCVEECPAISTPGKVQPAALPDANGSRWSIVLPAPITIEECTRRYAPTATAAR
jgi:hypothetical protein